MLSFLQSEAMPGSNLGVRKPERRPLTSKTGRQQLPNVPNHLNVVDPMQTGADPANRRRQNWRGRDYSEAARRSDTQRESEIQPAIAALDPVSRGREAAFRHWLDEATRQLDECSVCAEEDGLPLPSEGALKASRALLQRLSTHVSSQPDIYPMDESGIAIDFRAQDGRSGVLFVVDQDGSGAMFHCAAGMRGRLRVDDATQLPGAGAIQALGRAGIR